MAQYTHLNTVEDEAVNVEAKAAAHLESEIAQQLHSKTRSVHDELKRDKILQYESTREQTRVLFITNDTNFFDSSYDRRRQFEELTVVFDEIHIIVLGSVTAAPTKTQRLQPNLWLYGTGSRGFLKRVYDGYQRAVSELVFNDEFRADVIVALEPYEAGALAAYLSATYGRPWQVHLRTTPTDTRALGTHPWWRTRFMRYALKRAESVRTVSQVVAEAVKKAYPKLTDVVVLPHYFEVHPLLNRPDLKDDALFAQFAYTMIAIGELSAGSTMYRALDAVAPLLKTPTVGLVIIGDGPLKRHVRKRAQLLGIEKQVLFYNSVPNYLQYLASADVLVVTETTEASDELVLQAAALGTPTVMARNDLRSDLFTDGTNAFLCDVDDQIEYSQKLRLLLNQSAYRELFARTAPQVIRNRIEEDPRLYRFAYRHAIEAALWTTAAADPNADSSAVSASATNAETINIDGVEMRVPPAATVATET